MAANGAGKIAPKVGSWALTSYQMVFVLCFHVDAFYWCGTMVFLLLSAYSGTYCQMDRDGCAGVVTNCFQGVQCVDRAAPRTGYMCGPCPSGYQGDGVTCTGEVMAVQYCGRHVYLSVIATLCMC